MPTLQKSRAKVELGSYVSLRERVRETLLHGQEKIEQQKVLTYWHAGKLIKEHLLRNKERADLGQRLIEKLAEDLDLDESLLWKILKFARSFPVLDARPELSWAHYRTLMTVADEKKRDLLQGRAERDGWTSRELEVEVRNRKWSERVLQSEDRKPAQLPPVKLGPFHTYKIIQPKTIHKDERDLVLDCGFSVQKEMSQFGAKSAKFPAGTVVTSKKRDSGTKMQDAGKRKTIVPESWILHPVSITEELLYTYKAFVEKVIDGDTLNLDFRVGFGDRRGETIRLNGIDCPEIDTPEGLAAKRFVESQLAPCEFITVKSVRTRKEKWGRYLGDVFFPKNGNGALIYLNQLLLDKGHAVRVRA